MNFKVRARLLESPEKVTYPVRNILFTPLGLVYILDLQKSWYRHLKDFVMTCL